MLRGDINKSSFTFCYHLQECERAITFGICYCKVGRVINTIGRTKEKDQYCYRNIEKLAINCKLGETILFLPISR